MPDGNLSVHSPAIGVFTTFAFSRTANSLGASFAGLRKTTNTDWLLPSVSFTSVFVAVTRQSAASQIVPVAASKTSGTRPVTRKRTV